MDGTVDGLSSNNIPDEELEGDSEANDWEGNESEENDDDENTNYEDNSAEDWMAVDGVEDFGNDRLKILTAEVVKELHFLSLQVVYEFYNEYGRLKGFSVRKHKIGKSMKNEEILWQSFVCSKHGERHRKYLDLPNRQREAKPITRCGCKAEMRVHVDKQTGRWIVSHFEDVHNHPLFSPKFTGLLRSHRRMTEGDIGQMNDMRSVGISTPLIHGSFARQSGGYQMVGFRRKDMYNQIERQRRLQEGDANEALNYLRSLERIDPLMYWRHVVDAHGLLRHLFWCDGTSQIDYGLFGDVLAFDATYCRNKYKCPVVVLSGINNHLQTTVFGCAIVSDETEETYVCVLDNFLQAMKGKAPMSVLTDGDMAMRNAISRVFPNAHHRLCAWHLLRNAIANVGKAKFTDGFKKCMLGDYEPNEFEQKWKAVVEESALAGNSWVEDLTEKKTMWATAYMRGKFFAGLRTTSRCEALHSKMGRYVGSRDSLSEFLPHFQRCIDYIRDNEIQADLRSNDGEPVLQTQFHSLERSAAKLFTRETFYVFRSILFKAASVRVVGCQETASSKIYIVTKYRRAQSKWHVSYYQQFEEIRCSCMRMESFGMPCVHIVAVMVYLDIGELPKSLVLDRWSKQAKEAIETASNPRGIHG